MSATSGNWGVSTIKGIALDPEEFVGVLSTHQHRLLDTWQHFTPAQWEHQSRNADWTVHQTVRHVADAMDRCAGAVSGTPLTEPTDAFDPRSTPDAWLAPSIGESPTDTIERFAAASTRLRADTRDRLASGDDARSRTVYGTAHWSVNVVHVLWDSWLHERDVLLPLGKPVDTSPDEDRLVGLYGLLMALVPSMMSQQSFSATVQFTGATNQTVEATCDAGAIVSVEVPAAEAAITGAAPSAIDALAGRGGTVAEALPGAPKELDLLAHFLNS